MIGVLLLCLLGGVAAFYYWQNRPLPPIVSGPGTIVPGPAPDILSELPADAPVIAYLDAAALRALQNSPLAAALGLASPGPQADRDYANFVRDTGFDYSRDLDRAAIAVWPATFGTPANVLGEDRVLAVADGRFDQEKIKAYALRTGKVVMNGSQQIYEVPGNPPVSISFLSQTRIALTAGINSTALLSSLKTRDSAAPGRSMQARIQRVAGAPIFAVARTQHLPASFYANFHNAPQLEQLARSIQQLTLAGQPDGDNFKLTLDAECDSIKNAIAISILLEGGRMAGSMALSDPKARRQMTKDQFVFLEALIDRANITHQNKMVRLTLEITPAMLAAPPAKPTSLPGAKHPGAPLKPAPYPHDPQ